MSNPSFISFSGVSKSYDGAQYVVDDLNLDVRKGEFLSLLGSVRFGQDDDAHDARRIRIADAAARFAWTDGGSTTSRRISATSAWCFRTTRSFRI